MAGFNPSEPRDGHGMWKAGGSTRSMKLGMNPHMLSPQDHATVDLAAIRRKAVANVQSRMQGQQLGEAHIPRPTKLEKAYSLGLRGKAQYDKYYTKFSNTVPGKVYNALYKDRFTKLVPPGSKRDLAVRGAAAVSSLAVMGTAGLAALTPSWAVGKVMRAGHWAYQNYWARQEKKQRTAMTRR